MKLSDLVSDVVFAYRPRTSDSSAKPALVVEDKLWRYDEVWNNWDGAEKRTRQLVVTRAKKGDRAGSSNGYSSRNWRCGVPVLVIDEEDYMWSPERGERQLAYTAQEILTKAAEEMNPFKLVEEGYDGRFKEGWVVARKTFQVATAGGQTKGVTVTLEFVRPQTLTKQWAPHLKAVLREEQEQAEYKARLARMKTANDDTANRIRNRIDNIVGPADHYDSHGERYDARRKHTSTGISKTYMVSEEILLKLLALAERSNSQ